MRERVLTRQPYQEKYRLYLVGVGKNTEAEKESFSQQLSQRYHIPYPLLKRVVDRCPILLKKNMGRKKAESLARILKSFGAETVVEFKREGPPISVEFQNISPQQVALISAFLRSTQSGSWNVVGRVENISGDELRDVWVLTQLFGDFGDFLTFEEVPLCLNPFPPGESVPFKIIFEGDLNVQRVAIAFKSASGRALGVIDRRAESEWRKVEVDEEDEAALSIDLTRPLPSIPPVAPSMEAPLEQPVEVPAQRPDEEPQTEPVERPFPRDLSETEEAASSIDTSGGEEVQPRDIEREKAPDIATQTFQLVENEGPSSSLESRANEDEHVDEGTRTAGEESAGETTSAAIYPPVCSSEEFAQPGNAEHPNEVPGEKQREEKTELIRSETSCIDAATFEEASRSINEISKEAKDDEAFPSFSRVEEMRTAVHLYYNSAHDAFLTWFRIRRDKGTFGNVLHSVLTILVYARFDQGEGPATPLENTERVFRFVTNAKIGEDEIPALEGTQFFSKDQWRDLFYRAVPKLQQIARGIIEKNVWEALELQRLIQVIPHMSEKSARRAVRWISELVPQIEIDFSKMAVSIDEILYRVVCRLGIVDPLFDVNQGPNSMGYLKIQAFSRRLFPEDPSKIELPLGWVGREGNSGGHCLASQPKCEGCLFETFCQKQYLRFDPSEKGMGKLPPYLPG